MDKINRKRNLKQENHGQQNTQPHKSYCQEAPKKVWTNSRKCLR